MGESETSWEKISIGSDESGKGDFFGVPVVAAVYLSEKSLKELKKDPVFYSNLKDSKKCSDSWITSLGAPRIMKVCDYSVQEVSVENYNKLYKKFGNINVILSILHNKAHRDLKVKGKVYRIMDQFAKLDTYRKHLIEKVDIVPIDECSVRAESKYLSVALASIIARYGFIRQIEKLTEKSGVKIPMGNAYKGHNSVISAYSRLLEKGYKQETIDTEFVKSHFKTLEIVKKTLKL